MPSILEYAETEFSLLAEKPFTDVDSLLLSQFSYMNLSAFEDELKCENKIEIRELLKAERFEKLMFHVRDTKSNMRLLYAMASSPRWRNIKIGNFVEKLCDQSEEQFAAITVYLDDDHACAVFRGTDATLVGWKEDFNMAFLPVIPSQADAADYVTKLGEGFPGKLLLMGQAATLQPTRACSATRKFKSVLSASTRSTAPASSATRSNPKNMGAFKAAYIRSFRKARSSACCLKTTVHTPLWKATKWALCSTTRSRGR